MSILLSSNFLLSAQLPLDARVIQADVTARDAIPTIQRFFGLVITQLDDGTSWQLADAAMGGTDNNLANNLNWIPFGGGGSPSQPLTQIVVGTGTGETSFPDFIYDTANQLFNVAFSTGNGSVFHVDDVLTEILGQTSGSVEWDTAQFIVQDFARANNAMTINTGVNPQVNLGDFGNHGNSTWLQIDDSAQTITSDGDLIFNRYGAGTHTGTATFNLSVDVNGNVIETTAGGGSATLAEFAVGFGDSSNVLTGDATNFFYKAALAQFKVAFPGLGTVIDIDNLLNVYKFGDVSATFNNTTFIIDDSVGTYTLNKLVGAGFVTVDPSGVLGVNTSFPSGAGALIGQTAGLVSNPSPPGPGSETWLGDAAGAGGSSVINTVFIGTNSGININAATTDLTAVGAFAGGNAAFASLSTFFGSNAGFSAANAANSIFIGYNTGNSDTVDNTVSGSSILIGNNAFTNGFQNSIALGTNASNTAINEFMIGADSSPIDHIRVNQSGGVLGNVPVVVDSADLTAQTSAITDVTGHGGYNPLVDGSYKISGYVTVNSVTPVPILNVWVDYVNQEGTAIHKALMFQTVTNTPAAVVTIQTVTSYFVYDFEIRAQAGTPIIFSTTQTGTIDYDIGITLMYAGH